jgi:hypothetical protein
MHHEFYTEARLLKARRRRRIQHQLLEAEEQLLVQPTEHLQPEPARQHQRQLVRKELLLLKRARFAVEEAQGERDRDLVLLMRGEQENEVPHRSLSHCPSSSSLVCGYCRFCAS